MSVRLLSVFPCSVLALALVGAGPLGQVWAKTGSANSSSSSSASRSAGDQNRSSGSAARSSANTQRSNSSPSRQAAPARNTNTPWVYSQSTGQLTRSGQTYGRGYSGNGAGRNNPAQQGTRNVGPIPQGDYRIGTPHASQRTGPHVMDLTPTGHNAQGRGSFQIHGDNRQHNASHGCVILPPDVRRTISGSGQNRLHVVP
jgi:hypothetical protein